MSTFKKASLALCASALLIPTLAMAQGNYQVNGATKEGDREFSLSGSGRSDKDFDNGNFGVSGDMGWYLTDRAVAGIRQGVGYSGVKGASDKWTGTTTAFIDYHLMDGPTRPFVGASLGGTYGNGTKDSGLGGLELGVKHYVLPQTFIQARAEYQFYFDSASSADDNFSKGAWAYVLGMGYNF